MGQPPSHSVQAEPGNSSKDNRGDMDKISEAEYRIISLIQKESLENFNRLQNSKKMSKKEKNENIEQGTQTEETSILSTKNMLPPTGKETCKFLEILSKELTSFYESQTNHDCVLKVGERKFPVHRSLLAARSPVFAAMFSHDTFESRNEVDVSDVDATAFGEVLHYMYAGKIRGLSADTAASMYVVANKYSLVDLRDKCLDFLMYNLTVENICDAAILADTHNEEGLEKAVIQFIRDRLQELINSEKWRHFSTTHYLLANKLLSSALIASQTGKI